MQKLTRFLAVAGALALASCREGTAPLIETDFAAIPIPGTAASPQTAAAVLAALDQSGWSGGDFGAVGPATEFHNAGEVWAAATFNTAAAEVSVPEFWGRIRGEPVSRERVVTEQGDTAWASLKVDYDGSFLLDLTPGDGRLSVTSKRLAESLVQRARFEKGPPDGRGHRSWVLVSISPQQYVATDPERRTVKITGLTVIVNGETRLDLSDPAVLARIAKGEAGTVPLFARGDTVRVTVKVTNSTGTNNTPPTFAFLSSFHADPNGLGWRRMKMNDDGNGTFSLRWIAQQKGRERIIVEALDAQSFVTPTADDYRANIWGIPYQIQ